MSSPTKDRLPFFVYGTLRPGQPNYLFLLAGRVLKTEPATLAETCLFSLGRFPMAVARNELPAFVDTSMLINNHIVGDLITVDPSCYEDILCDLDQLEDYNPAHAAGSRYRRLMREVQFRDGQFVDAWVYMGNPEYLTPDYPLIPTGDWLSKVE